MLSPQRSHLAPLLIAAAGLVCLSGCGDDNSWWKDGFNGNDSVDGTEPPPRPPTNSIAESLVQASGAQQSAVGGLIENAAVVGEAYAAGTWAAASPPGATAIEVRHGFAPPLLPDWPHGIAAIPSPQSTNP